MSPETAALILNTVYQRTKEGAIPWTSTGSTESYEASFEDLAIRVMKESGRDNDTGEWYTLYYLDLINDAGEVASSIRPHAVDEFFDNPWEFTGDLFAEARDRALGVDKITKNLLSTLGGGVAPPPKKKKSTSTPTPTVANDDEEEIPF